MTSDHMDDLLQLFDMLSKMADTLTGSDAADLVKAVEAIRSVIERHGELARASFRNIWPDEC